MPARAPARTWTGRPGSARRPSARGIPIASSAGDGSGIYSGGIASDLFVHRVTRILKALDLKFPDRGVATGGKFYFKDSKAEVPDTYNSLLDYPEGTTVILVSSMANDTAVRHVIRGNLATLEFTRTGFTITPQKLHAKEGKVIVHVKSGSESLELHHRNLQNAIRKGEALKCDVMLGYYGVVAADIGVESYDAVSTCSGTRPRRGSRAEAA